MLLRPPASVDHQTLSPATRNAALSCKSPCTSRRPTQTNVSHFRSLSLSLLHPGLADVSQRSRVQRPHRMYASAGAEVGQSATTATKSEVLIVGGGPAGIATAMMLAKRGWTQVTVVERNDSFTYYEADKSYVYSIDGRGRKLLTQFDGLMDAIGRVGISTERVDINIVGPEGKTKNMTMFNNQATSNHWMPRAVFNQFLIDDGVNGVGKREGWGQHIRLMSGTAVETIEKDGQGFKVILKSSDGTTTHLTPRLVIGADGIGSTVRKALVDIDKAEGKQESKFETQTYESAAAGLRFKVVRLPANPVLSKEPGSQPVSNRSWGVVSGKGVVGFWGRDKQRIRLGLLPIKDESATRTANLITIPDHEVWEVKDAEGLYQYLERELPQFPARQLIPLEEAQRFAESRGGAFPKPQHVNQLQYVLKGAGSEPGKQQEKVSAVVLLGDARASFPPDLGQGVNSALEDVRIFGQALEECGDDLAKALPLYESRRLPEIKALIELMTFGGPYQYKQDTLQNLLWSVNAGFRTVLNKIAPSVYSKSAFMQLIDYNRSYQDILTSSHETTQRIQMTGAALAVGVAVAMTLMKMMPVSA